MAFDWNGLLVCIVAGYASVKLASMAYRLDSLMHTAFAIAMLSFAVLGISENLALVVRYFEGDFNVQMVKEWSGVISISLVLCGLAVLIRNAKPAFARFPLSFTALPLLIIVTYPLAIDTLVLKDWIMGIYEGGALLIGLLMYAVMSTTSVKYLYVVGAIALLSIAYTIYWFLPAEVVYTSSWIWQLFLLSGIVGLVMAYSHLENEGLLPHKSNGIAGKVDRTPSQKSI